MIEGSGSGPRSIRIQEAQKHRYGKDPTDPDPQHWMKMVPSRYLYHHIKTSYSIFSSPPFPKVYCLPSWIHCETMISVIVTGLTWSVCWHRPELDAERRALSPWRPSAPAGASQWPGFPSPARTCCWCWWCCCAETSQPSSWPPQWGAQSPTWTSASATSSHLMTTITVPYLLLFHGTWIKIIFFPFFYRNK